MAILTTTDSECAPNRGDETRLDLLITLRNEFKTLPKVAWHLRRLEAYYHMLGIDDVGVRKSVLIDEETIAGDLQSAYDVTIAEINQSKFKAAFWQQYKGPKPGGKARFWGPSVGYGTFPDWWLPWLDGDEADDT